MTPVSALLLSKDAIPLLADLRAAMPCDLEVDTDALRLAGSAARDAADCFGQPGRLAVADAVRSAVCHGSAPVREALRLAVRRAEEGLAAAQRISDLALGVATGLDSAADAFDEVENLCAAGF